MTASRILLLLTCLRLWGTTQSQKVFSLEYKYSQTKYMLGRGNSLSHQLVVGATKEVANGLRLGIKAGVTVDKVYSNFFGRNTASNYSHNNVLAYVGLNVQKCLLSGWQRQLSVWASLDAAAEPFISRKSVFIQYFPRDSFPENTVIHYSGAYIDKRTRFTVTPMLKAEVWMTKHLGVFAQAGYAVEVGKSNNVNRYITNIFTLQNFPETIPPGERTKENYLFAGGGISYAL